MSHWFHRNPIKPTKTAKFELKKAVTSPDASKITSELRLRREQFLDLLKSAGSQLELVETEFTSYLRLLYGFVFDVENPTKDSKLRYLGDFVWANSLIGSDGYESTDAWFEVLSICMNYAIWHMKRAASLSGKDDVSDLDAKRIHTALRTAAGIFQYVLDNREKVGVIPNAAGNDLEERVIKTYHLQSKAEAQEVTIARAIELKHSAKLISSLANETANIYGMCEKYIESFDEEHFEKWRKYFQLKNKFYLTYSYSYLAEQLLAEDKCGPAIRACKEGLENYRLCSEICKLYPKVPGPGFIAKPETHLFFRRIEPILRRHAEKSERENSMIYHDTVPAECPQLNSEAEFGLTSPIDFTYPEKADSWTLTTYQAFDISQASTPNFHPPKKVGKLPSVREDKVYETDRDPKNLSGCTIS